MPNDLTTNLSQFLAAGLAMPTGSVPVSLFTSTTSASNVNTGETDLITYAMPANTLSTNGQKVRVTIWGTFASNANAKTVRGYFGASNVITRASSDNGGAWSLEFIVARTGATTQIAFGRWNTNATGTVGNGTASPAETLSGAVTIKVTGQSGTASNDVTALAMLVEWLP